MFPVDRGVRQGCPASPLVFSLFMDRLEGFIADQVAGWSYHEKNTIRMAGTMIPLLLFADDIVLVSSSPEML